MSLQDLANAIIDGKREAAVEATKQAIEAKTPAQDIITGGLIAGMAVVGDRFKKNEYYVPEVLIAARAMHASLDLLRPLLAESGVQPVAVAAIGTVKGDLHDIGKNLVAMMLEGAGFQVQDLGVDVKPETFVQAAQDGANVICLSALLTTTMPAMGDTIKALESAGVRSKVKIMIGGAPVTQSYADEIKADGYAPDAATAVDKAKELLAV